MQVFNSLSQFVTAHKPRISVAVKLLIFGFLAIAIYRQVFANEASGDIWVLFLDSLKTASLFPVFFALTLIVVNWGLEAWKWKILITPIEKLSFWVAFKATLAGVTMAMFTPNRIGEYAGRILFLSSGRHALAVALTMVGSLAQIIVTLCAGSLSIMVQPPDLSGLIDHQTSWLVWFGVVLIPVLFVVFLQIRKILRWVQQIPLLRKKLKSFSRFRDFSKWQLFTLILLSFLRYSAYCFQFYLFLVFFGVEVEPVVAFQTIAVIFFIQMIIPTIALLELGIRGNVALLLLSPFAENSFAILGATYSLWLVNLVIPALAGYLFIWRQRIE